MARRELLDSLESVRLAAVDAVGSLANRSKCSDGAKAELAAAVKQYAIDVDVYMRKVAKEGKGAPPSNTLAVGLLLVEELRALRALGESFLDLARSSVWVLRLAGGLGANVEQAGLDPLTDRISQLPPLRFSDLGASEDSDGSQSRQTSRSRDDGASQSTDEGSDGDSQTTERPAVSGGAPPAKESSEEEESSEESSTSSSSISSDSDDDADVDMDG